MQVKDYVNMLKRQAQELRVICGYNEDNYGRAIVTTGTPKHYNEGTTTYVDQKKIRYEDYISIQFQEEYRRKLHL